ncbi:MAG: hypothetical protein IPN69_12440 [Acidobacteria bacterium]|nr:hypothetical protein [Acidobacteriota bacterium]
METILSLPLEKKIGQLFFIGIPGPEFDDATRDILEYVSPGGVCLFSRNIRDASDTRRLLDSVREFLPVEPLLSLDQEGGLVDRLRRVAEPMPAAGSLRTPGDASELARITAELVRILGFNMNFAPVVDVITTERGQFSNGLFSRTFGNSKEDTSEFAGAYLNELQRGHVTGCVKHFPGLGATEIDSHEDLPQVNLTFEELSETDLYPYRTRFASGDVRAVMIAHAAFPLADLQERGPDGKLLPSSLSFNFVTKLLRAEMGFEGVVITDDLEMGAILKNYGIGDASKMALHAGGDMLAVCNDSKRIREAFGAIVSAVRDGEIAEERIDRSLVRIAALKKFIEPPPDFDAARIAVLSGQIRSLKERQ